MEIDPITDSQLAKTRHGFKQMKIEDVFKGNGGKDNDGRDAFLVMSFAYYDRICLKSAVDFE